MKNICSKFMFINMKTNLKSHFLSFASNSCAPGFTKDLRTGWKHLLWLHLFLKYYVIKERIDSMSVTEVNRPFHYNGKNKLAKPAGCSTANYLLSSYDRNWFIFSLQFEEASSLDKDAYSERVQLIKIYIMHTIRGEIFHKGQKQT